MTSAQTNVSLFMTAIANSKALNIAKKTGEIKSRVVQNYIFWYVPDNLPAFSTTDTLTGTMRAKVVMDVIFKTACLSLATTPLIVAGDPIPMSAHLSYMTLIGTLFFTIVDCAPANAVLTAATMNVPPAVVAQVGRHVAYEEALQDLISQGGVCDQTQPSGYNLLTSF
jgi:hypothetical protein